MISGAQVWNKRKTRRIPRQKLQTIASCVTHAKKAHKPDQTDQPSPSTDHLTLGPTRQRTREGRWKMAPRWGSADPTWQPPRLSFGGKLVLILLRSIRHVSMYSFGGNRPQALYKGPPTTLSLTHHLEASLSTLSCDLYS